MSRHLTTAAATQASAQYYTLILMGKFEFDEPVYAHTGIGELTYDGNTYLGVGDFGEIGEVREAEAIGPLSLSIGLALPNASYLAEAMDAGNYGDLVTIYAAYRADDGTLVADPWVAWAGWYEFSTIIAGSQNAISVTAQHDLSILDEIDGSRFTDEDQRARYPADLSFRFIHEMADLRLVWGADFSRWGNNPDRNPGPGYERP